MLYYSKLSRKKIAHIKGCATLKKASGNSLATFKNEDQALKSGYSLCKCCQNSFVTFSPIFEQRPSRQRAITNFYSIVDDPYKMRSLSDWIYLRGFILG